MSVGIDPGLLAGCTVETCPILSSFYNYRIDLAPNVAFLTLFSIAVPWFAGVWIYTKRGYWFAIAMLLGLAAEIIGYAGRIISYNNQWSQNGFLIMAICLTLGPTFFSAAIYLCLAQIVVVYGPENSRLAPSMYTKIFIPCDIVAIILQATGGGMGAVALVSNQDLQSSDNVITAGLSSQVFTLFVFMVFCIEFGLRVRRRRRELGDEAALPQERHLVAVRCSKWFLGFLFAVGLATIGIFWRCCFRVAELNQGFMGPVTFRQNLFVGFEGVLMILVVGVLAIFHPALCVGETMKDKSTTVSIEPSFLKRSAAIFEKLLRLFRSPSSGVLVPMGESDKGTRQIAQNDPDEGFKEDS